MEMKDKKAISIFQMFLEQIIWLALAIIFLILATVIVASFSFQSGFVLPANYIEKRLDQEEEALRESFDASLLPSYCKYMLVDNSGNIKDSNMNEKDIEKTRKSIANGKRPYYEVYKEIKQTNGNIMFIKYDMRAHFSNPLIHEIIPNPELLVIVIIFALIIFFVIITALLFSKKLKKSLVSINMATEKIKAQDLNFEIKPTKIIEFNASLAAIDSLKMALTLSLSKQWNNEQQKKFQLASLAHDIKTPLCIIKGNAELLLEEKSSNETKEMLSYIQTSSNTIEKYLDLLMGVVNNESIIFLRANILLQEFIEDVVQEISPLCKTQNITLNFQNNSATGVVNIDALLLKRAIINIVDNSIRFSPADGQINFIVWDNKTDIVFEIIDCGKGFSPISLKNATQEFFTEDASRTSNHYGLGLSFVKRVVEMHNGVLTIENSSETNGAKVSISLEK